MIIPDFAYTFYRTMFSNTLLMDSLLIFLLLMQTFNPHGCIVKYL